VKVYLVRHAIASQRDPARWPDDSARPLTPEGEQRFARAARGLARRLPPPEVVLASPFARAWRTAELLQEVGGWPAPVVCREAEADRPSRDGLRALARAATHGAVALVGHEPNLSELASLLLSGDVAAVPIQMKKGGVAQLFIDGRPRPGSATLLSVLPPAILRSLA
jgi:phosphohistidine phosphatase